MNHKGDEPHSKRNMKYKNGGTLSPIFKESISSVTGTDGGKVYMVRRGPTVACTIIEVS